MGCNKLESLTLGQNFAFQPNCDLPIYSTPWVKQGTTSPTYTSSELMSLFDGSTMAGTYVRYQAVTISLRRNDQIWSNAEIHVALYQGGVEKYSYGDGMVSSTDGTITWNVKTGTYDVYASIDTEHISTLVDTGQDIVVSE